MATLGLSPHDPLLPREPGGLGLGAALALLAHGGLMAALALGLHWRIPKPPEVVSAELWAAVPQAAAPTPAPAPEAPPPAPVSPPTPAPAPAPTPAPPPAPSPTELQAQRDADIAIEKQREKEREKEREKLAAEKRHQAELAEAQKKREAQQRVAAEKEAAEKKASAEKAAADKKAAAEKKEAADKKAREDKLRDDKARKDKEAAEQREAQADAERLAKQREANLKRMMSEAGATGTGSGTGTAAADAAPSAAYAGRIKAEIKPNILLPNDVRGNPVAEVEVRCAPDGSILSRRIVKRSGNTAWDDAVLRAIDRTAKLPRDTDGRIPGTMILVFPRQE